MTAFDDGSSRRSFLVSGIAGVAVLGIGASAFAQGAACVLTPEQEEGPFYIPAAHMRGNLAIGERGIPLALEFRVIDVRTCAAIAKATVDIWHCDAMGVYSGFGELGGGPGGPAGRGPGGPGGRAPGGPGAPGGMVAGGTTPDGHDGPRGASGIRPHIGLPPHGAPPKPSPSNGTRYLRGVAATGSDGVARFTTIFPGFYQGRVNHVHLKVRVPGRPGVVHTGQLFFPEAIARAVSSAAPYASHKIHRTTLSEDAVYGGQHGTFAMADVRDIRHDRGVAYLAKLVLVVDQKATPPPIGV